MLFREAQTHDIPQIQIVRNAVKENTLSDPALVSDEDCRIFLTERGKGWVAVADSTVIGFGIADLKEDNIWALFVHPDFEKLGVGKKLHKYMLDWYFMQNKEKVWLGTAPATRAAQFYRMQGWKETGNHGDKEIKFELTKQHWLSLNQYNH